MTARRKKQSRKRLAACILFVAVMLGVFVYTVPQKNLPPVLSDNAAVRKAYDLRRVWLPQDPAHIEPAAGSRETGYRVNDRRQLDALVGEEEK